ncbi:hypothetical protein [Rhodococcus wratislaviensis]|uniref:hypothetical protein n=1 Tax=Rhodococcus wratislaviensis TaxID=44752 RepID=UPI0036699345
MGELAAASKVHVMVSYWWSRAGAVSPTINSARSSPAQQVWTRPTSPIRSRSTEPYVSRSPIPRRWPSWTGGGRWSKPGGPATAPRTRDWGLERSIRYLTDRLDAATVTPEALGECRRQVAAVDQTITGAKDLPELAHPDAEMLDLLARYLEARSRVLALA